MNNKYSQFTIFDILDDGAFHDGYISPFKYIGNNTQDDLFSFYNQLNSDSSHYSNRDDICTPMECVKLMVDYIPIEFWNRNQIKILDPCCGNGNFGAYCARKTDPDNIYYNDINPIRLKNCINLFIFQASILQ